MIDRPKKFNDHCISGETEVYTNEGYIKIKDLVGKEGQLETIDEQGNKSIQRFYNVRKTRENEETIKLLFEDDNYLVCTKDHLILTEKGWKEAQYLTEKDDIKTLTGKTKIKAILDNGKEDVYNMEVDNIHSFCVCEGLNVVIHNCVDSLRYGLMYISEKKKLGNVIRNIGF